MLARGLRRKMSFIKDKKKGRDGTLSEMRIIGDVAIIYERHIFNNPRGGSSRPNSTKYRLALNGRHRKVVWST
jgi:hypothetical protein